MIRRPAGMLAVLAPLLGGCGGEADPPASRRAPPPGELADDDRIAFLLAPCHRAEAFLADTGDMVHVLVSKLEVGELDPLRGAKEELIEMGDAALPELRRYCQRKLEEPQSGHAYLNAIAVVGAMDTHAGHDILVAGLGYAQDTVRIQALQGLARHAQPEDYDRVMALAGIASPDVVRSAGAALFTADRRRYEDDYAAWLAKPEEPEGKDALWAGAAERLADTVRPEILARFHDAFPRADGEARAYLAAAVAAAGDAQVLDLLRTDLADENVARRTFAVRALQRVGLTREAARLLWEDPDENLRGLVARAVSGMPVTQETTGWIRKGLLDRARSVRQICLAVLAIRGDEEAREQGLSMFSGPRGDFEAALAALREAWSADPAFAARSFDLLKGLRDGTSGSPRVDTITIDRAIALLPLPEAAEFLYALARTVQGEVDGLRAHRWYLMQAGNTGRGGRAWLRDRWAEEPSPLWRVDIAAAGSYDRDERSGEFLLAVIEHPVATPLEILHAANLLVHQGPAGEVAPRLKRVTLRVADPRVRPALNCLVWRWYGEGA